VKIVVLVKQVPDTYDPRKLDLATGLLDRGANEAVVDEINERALEVALQYKDSHKDAEIVVLTMGPAGANSALRKSLSMGADSAVHVLDDDLAGSDAARTAAALAAALKQTGFDLVVAGNESTDGRGGIVPAMIAEHLGVPHATSLNSTEIGEGTVSGERAGDAGTLTVHTSLPAVISVTERTAEGRFPNFKGILGAKKKPLTVLSLAELGTTGPDAKSTVLSTAERPARTAGKKIIDDGNAGVELVEYLVAERLV
jgi:electron transfer flavoprotein beta subunit